MAATGQIGHRQASQFLKDFVPLQKPPNFQLVADELASRFGFKRHRQSVAAFVRTHFPNLICQPEPRPKARRRWERARLGELWQHDSSIHQWWPAADKQTLLLTVDDHSRKLLGAVFVPTDTTWNHFEHFRRLFLQHGLPMVVYTDGLSLFGHDSMADDRDPCSEFQRAFSALGVTHLVAPSPQAKGKIERRFGTLQKRLVALLAYEHVSDYPAAQVVLDRQVAHQNATVCRTTGLSPNAAWDKALAEQRTAIRPCPPAALLDLHLALHLRRRVNADYQIDLVNLDYVAQRALERAAAPFHSPHADLPAVLRPENLDYDKYRQIEFRHDRALWAAAGLPFRVEFFHPGYLYQEPVHVNEFTPTHTQPIRFVQDFFNYHQLNIARQIPTDTGYAGFRVLNQLNDPDRWDELGAFLGASYFRLLGKNQRYGESARGLALDCGEGGPPGGISHLHRLVAGQAAQGRQ